MDKISNTALKLVNQFIELLEQNNLKIDKAYLYGSYAKGENNELSDIDLALVSDDFTGDLWDDKKLLREYKAQVSWDISPLPMTNNDFRNSHFVRDEILKYGIEIR